MFTSEFLCGLGVGLFLGVFFISNLFGLVTRYVYYKWIKGTPEKFIAPSEGTKSDNDSEEDEEMDEISAEIARVRNTLSHKNKVLKMKKEETEIGGLFDELKELSSGLMKNIPAYDVEGGDLSKLISDLPRITEEIRSNPTMQKMYTIVNKMGKEGALGGDDLRKMQEGMTEMVSSFFGGEISEKERVEQQRDSEIVLDRLRKIGSGSSDEEES